MNDELIRQDSPKMSLFQLHAELVELVELRDEMLEAGEDVAAVTARIGEYVNRELVKVDNVRNYLRHCVVMGEAAKSLADLAAKEAEIQRARSNSWRTRGEWLKGFVKRFMEAAGKKRLDGMAGYLILKGDGGKQSIDIYDGLLVPDEFCKFTLQVETSVWIKIREILPANVQNWIQSRLMVVSREPQAELIRLALAKDCEHCHGAGRSTGYAEHPETGARVAIMVSCEICGGSGKQVVPGARLVPRGSHVEIR